MSTPTSPDLPLGIEIVTTRIFAAPRERVYHAFANPVHLAQWWGPNGFTNTVEEFDLGPGGAWRITMHGPDGKDYPNVSEFIAVLPRERIVYLHLGPMHRFRMTMSYADAPGGQTRMTWRMVLDRTEENERLRSFLAVANEQNFDRLAAHLAKTAA